MNANQNRLAAAARSSPMPNEPPEMVVMCQRCDRGDVRRNRGGYSASVGSVWNQAWAGSLAARPCQAIETVAEKSTGSGSVVNSAWAAISVAARHGGDEVDGESAAATAGNVGKTSATRRFNPKSTRMRSSAPLASPRGLTRRWSAAASASRVSDAAPVARRAILCP